MKRANELPSIMAKETFAINDVCMNGSQCMVNEPSITSAEYMSLSEWVAIVHGINIMYGEVVAIMIITSLMIYLVNTDQSRNNNTMMRI
jgi:hypothetical protein